MINVAIVTAPARLHFGLINMHLESASVDGGFGLAVRAPGLKVILERAKHHAVYCAPELEAFVRGSIELAAHENQRSYAISVETENSFHLGLGLGTQLALSIAAAKRAFAGDAGLDGEAIAELARGVGRAGTSGVGCYCFARGGFVVDLGRPRSEKTFLGPSSEFGGLEVPPALPKIVFPKWRVIIAIPKGLPRIFGLEEVNLFRKYAPIAKCEAEELTETLFYRLIPSVLNKSFVEFCVALEATRRMGFKRREIAHNAESFAQIIHYLEQAGLAGVTVSSWGPAVVGFSDTENDDVQSALSELKRRDILSEFWITHACNEGASVCAM